MHDAGRELQRRMIAEALEQARREPPAPPKPSPPPTIHFSELKENTSGDPTMEGWNVYVREVTRLIAEGHEGKWVVIAEGRLIGVYDTEDEAEGILITERFTWPSVVKQILVQDPIMRVPFWYERYCRCRN